MLDRNRWVHQFTPDRENDGFKVWNVSDGWYWAVNSGRVHWTDDIGLLWWLEKEWRKGHNYT